MTKEKEFPNPIPAIRATLSMARLNGTIPHKWQIDPTWHAAFENQGVVTKTLLIEQGAPMPELPTPTMGGIPFSVNAYLPEGTAVLIDDKGNIFRILRFE